MISIKDEVSMRYGKGVADELDRDGLLAKDYADPSNITAWRVKSKDTGNVKLAASRGGSKRVPNNLGRSLAAPLWKHVYPGHYADEIEGSQDYPSEGTALRQANMAKRCGLQVEIVPLATIELPQLRYTPK